ncbi:hypothetical protein L3X38_000171 (mitochondrion) [Prunus dulcis]|uniref:Retrotransposon gag domain-containing protein n=1 Tax=Prunus dulcis TaxID=3755 RepID=A0AAD4UQ57_PRUDU|nr:hypothetical protein L3X38_000171 [Prunus dulcis]
MAKSAKIARIEALEKDLEVALSAAQTKRIETLEVKISELENHLAILPSSSDRPTELEASQSDAFEFFTDNVKETVNTLQNSLQELNAKNPGPIYGGNIDAKEVDENFLFDMEQDCRVVRTDSEEHKVTIATMYFTGDAKLWWRSKVEDIQNNRCTISTRAQTRAIPPRKCGVEITWNAELPNKPTSEFECFCLCLRACPKIITYPRKIEFPARAIGSSLVSSPPSRPVPVPFSSEVLVLRLLGQ